MLDAIDSALASLADSIQRTRKGKVWDLHVRGRPVHVSIIGEPPIAMLSAGCNDDVDYTVLQDIGHAIVQAVGGTASEPTK